ncbi:PIF-1 [Choristoneura occidentalis granulovirus]|uniref:PIF-1 n=1 Tax=Choristoneura occidentalis granulovirus TaxID=364745 RepID=Q1A4P0_9BBAC|nr:PIF-1 [Choristoneura fumiferana granulovirus]ABC61190.1 PIF-1 [Choristoneura fumiferana granulovirus]
MLLIISVVIFCLVLAHHTNLANYAIYTPKKLYLYDNLDVPLLNPPKEIIINENELSCHTTPTRCTSNADCQLCLESLASCQEFHETVILEINEFYQLVINPGDKYCLALDNRSARSCNPNTGTWVLRRVDSENFALICHCDMPGLVTQLNIYDDCTLPVGCKPHGVIANINSSPLVCLCKTGYIPEISSTNTPYCRPQVMRDVMLLTNYYHRPPCQDGFIRADHPVFDSVYRQQIGANICLPDPCSIDPLTGEKHEGRVLYDATGGVDGGPLVMCQCDIRHNLYPVHSNSSMLNVQYSEHDWEIANYCIKPLTVDRREIRSDLKVFWARNSLKSDADIVFQVNQNHVQEPYRVLLYKRLTNHPTTSVNTLFILKFKLNSAYISSDFVDVFQGYWHLNYLRTNVQTCPLPGIGECTNPQQCGNISCSFNPCIRDTVSTGYRNSCYFFRANRTFPKMGSIGQICVWNSPTYYNRNNVPITFYLNALGTTDGGYGVVNDVRTLYFTNTNQTVAESQYDAVIQILNTYPLYRS